MFPENRSRLEPIAKEQIDLLNQNIELEKEQITKLKQIESLPLDKNFLEYSKLNREVFEKRLEGKELGIEKFQLILDKNISSQKQLEDSIFKIKQKQSEIDSKIAILENQQQNIRKNAGK